MKRLDGRHVVVTAGPTVEPIDPVRFLSNRSSGKQGYAIAAACKALGARVTLVSGPVCLKAPDGVERVSVETAEEMLGAVRHALPADVFIAVAAVADWRPAQMHVSKQKKDRGAPPPIVLTENPDILKTVATGETRPALVIGFAAETEALEENAKAKLARKGADWIVANDVSGDAMGGDDNEIALVTPRGVQPWPRLTKLETAARLAARIAETL